MLNESPTESVYRICHRHNKAADEVEEEPEKEEKRYSLLAH